MAAGAMFRYERWLKSGAVSIVAHQIDLFCLPQMLDAKRLDADHIGGYLSAPHHRCTCYSP
jgi:hypothetical protein